MTTPVQSVGRRRVLRRLVRGLALAAAVILAWPLQPEALGSVWVPALSPLLAGAVALSLRSVGVLALLAVPVALLAAVFPRWFCRYGCPVGLLQEWVARLRPSAGNPWRRWPAIGHGLVLLTLGGALAGYPLFLWLDPLAIFNGFMNAWRQPIALATLVTGMGLPLLLLLELAIPRFWCRRVCPLGATQDGLAALRRWFRNRRVPPEPVRETGGKGLRRGRRRVLAALTGTAGVLAVRATGGPCPALPRPPGALDESRFTGVCIRCGNCAQACPAKIIRPDLGAGGLAGLLAPRLGFAEDYCREDCHRCGMVCPSGAIARLSLAEKRQRVIGLAIVDLDRCLLAQGRECTACIQKCPYAAIAMHSADGGFSNEPLVLRDRCNGCGACETVCPALPVRAIRIRPQAASRLPSG